MKPDTIPRQLFRSAEVFSSAAALVDEETGLTLSFAGLAAASRRAARAFLALGVAHGDRVAIWAPNLWEWVVAALGAQSVGAVLVPLNTRFKGQEAAYLLAKSGARVLCTVNGFLGIDYPGLLRDVAGGAGPGHLLGNLPELRTLVILRGEAPLGTLSWQQFLARADAVPDAAAESRALAVKADDVSDMMFTSGTTGRPKGVLATHAQTLRTFHTWSEIVGLKPGDEYLIVNPYFHSFGYKAGWLSCLIRGATNRPHAKFDVPSLLGRIQAERITVLPGPPTLYHAILQHPGRARFDLSSLRLAVTGAATIPVTLIHRMRSELTFETILTAYGLTECCGVATMCRVGDDPETIAASSGRAIPDTEVEVVDENGVEVARGEAGEVRVRGYQVMRGYHDDPEATAAAIDGQGWLHTGDIGVMDKNGNLKITDRTKDMFIVGGFNAYPAEIENLLLGHGAVAQAAVVGVPDERLGEVAVAFIVVRSGTTASAGEIIEWAGRTMANYKVPRHVELVSELPLNATGKVLKYQLRERAASLAGRTPTKG